MIHGTATLTTQVAVGIKYAVSVQEWLDVSGP